MSSGLIQVFIELGNLHGTLNYNRYAMKKKPQKNLNLSTGKISYIIVVILVK